MVSAAAPHGMRSNAMTGQPVSVRDHTHAASRKIAPARRLRTIKYAAEYLDVSTRTIERYIAIGKLDAYRVGDRLVRLPQSLTHPLPGTNRPGRVSPMSWRG
jgi:excisionase family DNA binding protein